MPPRKQGRNRRGQFRPGVSGNPGGRPAGRVSIAATLRALAAEEAPRTSEAPEGETWADRIARMILARAAEGDLRAAALALDRIDGRGGEPPAEEVVTIEEVAPRYPIALPGEG